jgi:Family of unknown function (DUF5681)
MTRFVKGQSGNPKGRPRARRPDVSAFDIIFDKRLTATQNGVERELTIDEALHLQTYQAALKGQKMAIRAVLKMIEKREIALARLAPQIASKPIEIVREFNAENADEPMRLLGIASYTEPDAYRSERQLKLEPWVTELVIDRQRRRGSISDSSECRLRNLTHSPECLKLPEQPA